MRYFRLILAVLLVLWGPSAALGGTNYMRGTFAVRDTATGNTDGVKLDGDTPKVTSGGDLTIDVFKTNANTTLSLLNSGISGGVWVTNVSIDGDLTVSGGDVIGIGGVTLDLGEATANAATFTGATAFLSADVGSLGSAAARWGTVYGVDANFSGNTTLGDAVGDALTILPTTWTVSTATNIDAFVTGANSTLSIINSGVSGGTRVCNASIDGTLIIGDDYDPVSASIGLSFGDTSHYIRWNNANYFQASHNISGTFNGTGSFGALSSTANSTLGDAAADTADSNATMIGDNVAITFSNNTGYAAGADGYLKYGEVLCTGTYGFVAPQAGSIVGLSVNGTAVVATSCAVSARIGTADGLTVNMVTGTPNSQYSVQAKGVANNTFAAGNILSVYVLNGGTDSLAAISATMFVSYRD